MAEMLDCVIVGGGPAGLTAALYLARFGRRFALIDAGEPRAAWIPKSHNIPFFEAGISGEDILQRQFGHLERYGVSPVRGVATGIAGERGRFTVTVDSDDAESRGRSFVARRVLLASGSRDVEPDLPDLPDAIRRGLVRYCPICDGFEAGGKKIAVIGHGAHALGEAVFVARTYSQDVTLLTLGKPMELDPDEQERVEQHGVKVIAEPVTALDMELGRIAAIRAGGAEHRFDVLYSALGLERRSGLAADLGAKRDEKDALIVDEHQLTTVPGLYAAGGVVRGLDQIVVAMGQAAVAATHIHNHCELPTEEEEGGGSRAETAR